MPVVFFMDLLAITSFTWCIHGFFNNNLDRVSIKIAIIFIRGIPVFNPAIQPVHRTQSN